MAKHPSWLSHGWLSALALVLPVFAIYSPVWWSGYIWDDDFHLTQNPCVIGPLGIKEIWTTNAGPYFPFVITTFWIEHAIWGLEPLPYHLVNVIQHATCALLLWRVLLRLKVTAPWLGAAMWAFHPVQVESVAWISEMKNTESGLFYLLAILFFLRSLNPEPKQNQRDWNYAASLLCGALAMASKATTVVLPVVLILCTCWLKGRWHWSELKRLIPFFLMSVVAGYTATMWPQSPYLDVIGEQQGLSWLARLATAGDVFWFYLGKLLWPHPLIFIYPRWTINVHDGVSYLPTIALILLFFVLLRNHARARSPFFALLYFLVVLSPFLGFIDQTFWQYSYVEDHLQYLASMAPLALAGAAISNLTSFEFPNRSRLLAMSCSVMLLAFGWLSWQRNWVFVSQDALWTDTLANNPNCWIAYNILGNDLAQNGRYDEAIKQFRKGMTLNPNYYLVHNNLGVALAEKGQFDEAILQFKEAIRLKPDYRGAPDNLAKVEALARKVPSSK